ncbi:MAG TPA: hypothetical protein DCS05_05550 [Nitrospiraceae bacterium]|nr:hypothetical protein [Nitrospiraceae bacterium]
MRLPPLAHPFDVNLILEVIRIFRGPTALARGLAGLTALRFAAVDLLVGISTIGGKETLAERAAPL